MAIKKTAKR